MQTRSYEGNYSEFMEKKEQVELAERHFDRQQDYIKQEEPIRRNIAGQNTKQAGAASPGKLDASRSFGTGEVKFSFPETQRGGDVALVLKTRAWAGQPLYPWSNTRSSGQKLGIVGLNGTGKSTLLKAILRRSRSSPGRPGLAAR